MVIRKDRGLVSMVRIRMNNLTRPSILLSSDQLPKSVGATVRMVLSYTIFVKVLKAEADNTVLDRPLTKGFIPPFSPTVTDGLIIPHSFH